MLLPVKNCFGFCSVFPSFWASFCFAPTPALTDSFGNSSREPGAGLYLSLSWDCLYGHWGKTAAWLLLLRHLGLAGSHSGPCVSHSFNCIRHEVVVHEVLTVGYRFYRTKIKPSSTTDRWETNLREQPSRQKNDETAQVLQFRIELFKILGFFSFLLETMNFFPPTVLKCESCQFLGVRLTWDSCSITLEEIKMCQASSLVWNNNFFRILFYLLKVLLVMVSGKTNKQKPKMKAKHFLNVLLQMTNVTNFLL